MNRLSLFTWSFSRLYYLKRPWKWFKELYWNIRNFIHRGKYGYSYTDVWDFCTWYPRVGAEALRYLAKHGCGYPGIQPWDTPERWEEHLLNMARKLDKCADTMDFEYSMNENEYANEFYEEKNKIYKRKENEDGTVTTWVELTPEQEKIKDKYFEREEEIQNSYDKYREETYAELGQMIGRYWD